MTILLALAIAVSAAYAFACLFLYLRQDAYMYVPTRGITDTPATAGLAFEDLSLLTRDGERLNAWFVPAANPQPWILLYCHGNAGNLSDRVPTIRNLHDRGFTVLMFSYRGYGNSTGKPSEAGTYEDALTAWRHLTETRHVPPDRILIYGHSLGAAIACWLATQVRPHALVLDAPFTSALDMGAAMFPYLPVRILSRYRYDTLSRIPTIGCPVFIAHGDQDDTIPISHGLRVFAAASEPKAFAEFVGDHAVGGFDPATGYCDKLLAWLRNLPS